ncbi:MAG: 6-phosphogluconolactonase [Thermomicrobiales bacterium]|nr:6-phosphogluconolactonase [Thermomicrobiales bacterium]
MTGTESATVLDFGPRGQVQVVNDSAELAHAAAELFASTVDKAVAARGKAFVALSGGSTPKQMGALLAREPFRSRIPWDKVEIFWGDERCVPLGSPESNAGEAMRGYLDLVGIPRENIHPWMTDPEAAAAAAMEYEVILRSAFGQESGTPRFDLVLLGMGDDGHTASLFPHTAALQAEKPLAVANFVPKLDAIRLTLTRPVLNSGRAIVFLAGGPGKAAMLRTVLEGPVDPEERPAQSIAPTEPDGSLTWLVDKAAAARLSQAEQP